MKSKKFVLTKEHIGGYPKGLPFSRIFRNMAIPLVKLLIRTPVTPNQLTSFSILLTIVRFVLFISGNALYIFIGVFVMLFDKVLDYADGPLARFKGIVSLKGIFLDKVHHDFHFVTLFLGLSIGVFNNTSNLIYLIFGGLAVIFYLLSRNLYHFKTLIIYAKSKNPMERIKEKEFSSKAMTKIMIIKKVVDFPRMYGDMLLYLVAPISLFFNILPYYIIFYGAYNAIYYIPLLYYTSTFKEDKKKKS